MNYLTNNSEPVLIYDFLNPSSTEIQSINEWQSCHKNATINVATDYIDFVAAIAESLLLVLMRKEIRGFQNQCRLLKV